MAEDDKKKPDKKAAKPAAGKAEKTEHVAKAEKAPKVEKADKKAEEKAEKKAKKAEKKAAAPRPQKPPPAPRPAVAAKPPAAPKLKRVPEKTLTVTQIGSPIGRQSDQRATLKGLGLNKLRRSRVLEDTPTVRGMMARVRHLVRVDSAA